MRRLLSSLPALLLAVVLGLLVVPAHLSAHAGRVLVQESVHPCQFYCGQIEIYCDQPGVTQQYHNTTHCLDVCVDFALETPTENPDKLDTLSCRSMWLLDLVFGRVTAEIGCNAAGSNSTECVNPAPPTPAPTFAPAPTPAPTTLELPPPIPCNCTGRHATEYEASLVRAQQACQQEDLVNRVPGVLASCCAEARAVASDHCMVSFVLFNTQWESNDHQLISFMAGICNIVPESGCIPECGNGVKDGYEECMDCLPAYWQYDGSMPDPLGLFWYNMYPEVLCPRCPPVGNCYDGCQNGNETAIDFGGNDCPAVGVPPTEDPFPTGPPTPAPSPLTPAPTPAPTPRSSDPNLFHSTADETHDGNVAVGVIAAILGVMILGFLVWFLVIRPRSSPEAETDFLLDDGFWSMDEPSTRIVPASPVQHPSAMVTIQRSPQSHYRQASVPPTAIPSPVNTLA